MKPTQWMRIAAVASAVGLAGTAIANDMDNAAAAPGSESAASVIDQATPAGTQSSVSSSDDTRAAANAGTSATSDLSNNANGTAGTSDLSNDATGTAATSDLANPSSSTSAQRGAVSGATQGSTMRSPQGANTGSTAGAGHDRLAGTTSSNFNAWASDYAAQHNGRITRDEFLDQMGRRFDELDTQRQGSLTPYQVQEILIVTPAGANGGSAASGSNAASPTLQ